MAFDILTGDQLFVDRMSYHFVPPAVGSGFVFRTGNIEGLARSYGDQYYIKRLVGVPGDTLELRGFELQRNGAPITGAAVFAGNARQEGNHVGYRYEGLLRPGTQVKVGPGEYFALGRAAHFGLFPVHPALGSGAVRLSCRHASLAQSILC